MIDIVTFKAMFGWFLVAFGVIIISYAAVRAGSIAYFRTRLEYYRSVLREGSNRNGKG